MSNGFDYKFIDIHSHIIPGVDDGAETIKESVKMLKIAAEENIGFICATPHFRAGFDAVESDKLKEKFESFKLMAEESVPDIQLFLGNELFYNEDVVESLQMEKCVTLNGGNYVLVEFHPSHGYSTIRKGVSRLLNSGVWPIIAHVERYDCLEKREDRIVELKHIGAYIQVNASSVSNQKLFGGKRWVRHLLKNDLVNFIATDTHNAVSRPPKMLKAAEVLGKYGDDHVRKILWENPLCVLRNEII